MNFLQMVQEYCADVELDEGNPSSVDGQTGELARMVRDIRNANREIQLFITDWEFRRKTDFSGVTAASSNGVTITTPASGVSIITEYDEDSFWLNKTSSSPKQLEVIDYEKWRDELYIGTQTAGQPDNVIIMPDRTLKVYPTADAIYTITCDYFRTAVDFSTTGGGAEESVIPADFHRLIIVWAQLYYAKRESAPEYSDGVKWELDYLMERLKNSQAPDQKNAGRARTTPQAVRVR